MNYYISCLNWNYMWNYIPLVLFEICFLENNKNTLIINVKNNFSHRSIPSHSQLYNVHPVNCPLITDVGCTLSTLSTVHCSSCWECTVHQVDWTLFTQWTVHCTPTQLYTIHPVDCILCTLSARHCTPSQLYTVYHVVSKLFTPLTIHSSTCWPYIVQPVDW